MPLDSRLEAVLQSMVASGASPMHALTVEEAREHYFRLTRGSLKPEEVVSVANIDEVLVGGAVGQLVARVFRPEGDGPFPTIVFFHGGGFVVGDLNTHDNMCRELCRGSGAVVVSVDYRLAPEHPFPAAVEDAIAATTWILGRTNEFGGTDVVAVAGDSAGGNLAAVVAQQLRGESPPLVAQFLLYPAVDNQNPSYPSYAANGEGYLLERATLDWFHGHYVEHSVDVTDPRLAPIKASGLAGLPAALIVTAEFDPLRDEAEAYGKALREAGNKAEVIRCEGMIHAFFDMGRWSPSAQRFISKTVDRFGQILREN